MGFHLVAEVGKHVQKYKKDSCIPKEKLNTKQYKNTEYTKEIIIIQNLKINIENIKTPKSSS